jgi:phenylacetate-CoA ligase
VSKLQLRSNLVLDVDEETRQLFVQDGTTGRRIGVDPTQAAVMEALDAGRGLAQIAAELFEDEGRIDEIESFVDRLRAMGLLEEGLTQEQISERQVEFFRRGVLSRQSKGVAEVIHFASEKIPFYREHIGKELGQTINGIEDLSKVPLMEKVHMRENFPTRMVPDDVDPSKLLENGDVAVWATSGSTGQRLSVFYDLKRSSYPSNFPGVWPIEGRWTGVRCAIFTTPVCSGTVCHMGGMSREERIAHDGFYFTLNSSDHIMTVTRSEVDDILGDLFWFKPNVIRLDPIYMVSFVRAVEREGLAMYQPKVVWTAYEYYSVLYQDVLRTAFPNVPIFTVYGVTDLGGGCQAFRCEHGVWHAREDQYKIEFLRNGKPVEPGRLGEMTVTSFCNRYMPVIRYRVRDVGRPLERACSCSHGEWQAFQLEARMKDCLYDTSGKLVTTRMFDNLFEGLRWIDFYGLTQVKERDYELLAVRRPGQDTEPDESELRRRAAGLLGKDANLKIRYVRELPVETSYKFALTQSKIFKMEHFHQLEP